MKALMKKYKRGIAGFLAFCMMMTSMNTAAWASEGIQNTDTGISLQYHLDGEQLKEAAMDAIQEGSRDEALKMTPENLGFVSEDADASIKKYARLFADSEDGSFYELSPEFAEGEQLPEFAGLRMFVRANASEDYTLTGKEQIVFLFSNKTEERLTYQIWVDDNKLPPVAVKANAETVSDLEGAPLEGTVESAEDGTETTAPEENGTVTEEKSETDATDAVGSDVSEEADDSETDVSEETDAPAADAADVTEAADPVDNAADDEVISDSDDGAVSISALNIPVVAVSDDDEVYYEDVSLTNDLGSNTSNQKTSTKQENRIATDEEIAAAQAEAAASEPVVVRKSVTIEGKLYDNATFTIDEDTMMIRAFVTTLDNMMASEEIVQNDGNKASATNASPSNATLVITHAYPGELDYVYIEETVTSVQVGSAVSPEDYKTKIDGYVIEKTVPESLEISQGSNSMTIYYEESAPNSTKSSVRPSSSRKGRSVVIPSGTVVAKKTADWKENSTTEAEIQLMIQGIPIKPPVDVILVLDGSGSMSSSLDNAGLPKKRLELTYEAAVKFADSLFANNTGLADENKNRIGFVSFAGTEINSTPRLMDSWTDSAGKVSGGFQGMVDNTLAFQLESYLKFYPPTIDGTNYLAGLDYVDKVFVQNPDELTQARKKYVIFLSDGKPNLNEQASMNFAKQLQSEGIMFYSIGVNLQGGDDSALKAVSSNPATMYRDVQDPTTLSQVFAQIAGELQPAGYDAEYRDVINGALFEVIDQSKLPSGVTFKPLADGNYEIIWKVGTITEEPKTLTIPIKLKDDVGTLDPGVVYPNDNVYLTYTDINGVDQNRDKDQIGHPPLSVEGGTITVNYYRANSQGQYTLEDGTILNNNQMQYRELIGSEKYTVDGNEFVSYGSHTVTAKNIVLDKDGLEFKLSNVANTQTVNIQPANANQTVDFPVYRENKFAYTVNYYDGSVSGANLLKSETGEPQLVDTEILPLIGNVNKYIPEGKEEEYRSNAKIQNVGDGKITNDVSKNVINIIYVKKPVIEVTGPGLTIDFGMAAPSLTDGLFTYDSTLLDNGDVLSFSEKKYNGDIINVNTDKELKDRTKIDFQVSITRPGVGTVTTSEYVVKTVPGTLTIQKIDNVIYAEPTRPIYDGIAKTIDVSKVSADSGSGTEFRYSTDPNAPEDQWLVDPPAFTEAGTHTIYIKATHKNYNEKVESVEVDIQKRPITIQAGSKDDWYTETKKTVDASETLWTVLDDISNNRYPLPNSQEIYKITQTGVANVVSTNKDNPEHPADSLVSDAFIRDINTQKDISMDNFDITYAEGRLVLLAGKNQLTLKGVETTYDGNDHAVQVITPAPAPGSTIHYTVDGKKWDPTDGKTEPSFTEAGTYVVTAYVTNPNYADTEPVTVSVVIEKRKVTVSGRHLTKIFNGSPLIVGSNEYDFEAFNATNNSGLLPGHTGTATVSGSLDHVASGVSYPVSDPYTITAAGNQSVLKNYQVISANGTMTMTASPELAIVEAKGYVGPYDGAGHGILEGTIKIQGTDNVPVTDYKLQYSDDGVKWQDDPILKKDADDYTIFIKATSTGYSNEPVLEVPVKIEKFNLHITSLSKEFTYNGENQSFVEYTTEKPLVNNETVPGETLKVYFNTSVKDVTTGDGVDNKFTFDIEEGNVEKNYNITTTFGKLTVKARDGVALSVPSVNQQYDGNTYSLIPQVLSGVTPVNDTFEYLYSFDQGVTTTQAPSYKNVTAYEEDVLYGPEGSVRVWVKAVNSNFTFDKEWVETSIRIYPRVINVKANDKNGLYNNGQAPKNVTYDYTINKQTSDEIVSGDDLRFSAAITPDYNGTYEAGEKIDIVLSYQPNNNYVVNPAKGTLTIDKSDQKLQIDVTGSEKTYNGNSHFLEGYSSSTVTLQTEITWLFLKENGDINNPDDWTTVEPSYTNQGTYPVTVKARHNNYQDSDPVTKDIVVNPKKIIIVPDNKNKTYNEKDPAFTGTILDADNEQPMSLYGTDNLNILYGRAEADKDKTDATLNDDDRIKIEVSSYAKENKNYEVDPRIGYLTITKDTAPDISVAPSGGVYNAENYSVNDVTSETEGYLDDTRKKIEYYNPDTKKWSEEKPVFTEAGRYEVNVRVQHPNYEEATTTAVVEITKKPIIIAPRDESKDYDGEALVPSRVVKMKEGTALVGGQFIADNFTVNGSQTEKGSSDSSFDKDTIQIMDKDGVTVRTLNYDITCVTGDLTVKEAALTIVTSDQVFGYASMIHTFDRATVQFGGKDISGITVEYSLDGITWSTELPGFMNVSDSGTVQIRANADGKNPNFGKAEATAKVTVNPENIHFTVFNSTKEFNQLDSDATPAFGGSYTGKIYPDDQGNDELVVIGYGRVEGNTEENVGAEIPLRVYYEENPNYSVTYDTGILKIIRSGSNGVSFDSVVKTYDGKDYSLINVNATVPTGSVIEFSLTPEVESSWDTEPLKFYDVNLDENGNVIPYRVYVRVENPGYEPVGFDNDIFGTVTINQKEVTLSVTEFSKTFGDLDPEMKTVLSDQLVKETDLGDIKAERVNAATEDEQRLDPAGAEIPFKPVYTENTNYKVTPVNANLLVNKKDGLKVTADPGTAVYDKTGHPYNGSVLVSGTETGDTETEIWYSRTGEDGSWSMEKPDFTNVNFVNNAVTGYTVYVQAKNPNYFDSDVVETTMTITQKPVTIIGESYTKTFGKDDPTFTFKSLDGVVDGDDLNLTFTRADQDNKNENITTETNKAITIVIGYDRDNHNYEMKQLTEGTLTILPAVIKLNATAEPVLYDGETHEITVTGLEDITAPTVTYVLGNLDSETPPLTGWGDSHPELTEAGTYRVFVRAEKENYVSDTTFTDLTIQKREVIITVDTVSGPYTGTALTSDAITVQPADNNTGLVAGHDVTAWKTSGSVINVGPAADNILVENSVVIESANGEVKTQNYIITRNPGKLSVTAIPAEENITIDAENKEWTFNNNTHQYPAATSKGVNGIEDDTIVIEYSIDGGNSWSEIPPLAFVDADVYPVLIRATSPNYTGTASIERNVTIKQKPVTITVAKAEKLYNTEDPTITGLIEGLVPDDDTPIRDTAYNRIPEHAALNEVGDVISTYAYYTEDPNYDVSVIGNVLEILPIDGNGANVKPGGGEYNGQQYGLDEVKALQTGSTIWYATSPDAPESQWTQTPPMYTEVGEYPVYIKITNKNYYDAFAESKIVITARVIVVRSDDANKLFDTTPLTKNSAHVVNGEERLVNGHSLASVTVSGTQTAVGSSNNTIAEDAVITMEDPRLRAVVDVTHNYEISYEEGILEVKENPHDLTIRYAYHEGEEGNAAALPPTYQSSLTYNSPYNVATPEIPGYMADIKVVEGTMLLEAISATVIYHRDENGNKIPDCEEDRFTITFLAGNGGTLEGQTVFQNILTGLTFGQTVVVPNTNPNFRYSFDGWKDTETGAMGLMDATTPVTGNKTYEAQWTYLGGGSSGGGGGGGNRPGGNGGGSDNGPGVETSTILPDDVPLAALPTDMPDGTNLQIDDGQIPLAALPKTGEKAAGAQLAVIFSGLFMSLFLALKKKKENEQ